MRIAWSGKAILNGMVRVLLGGVVVAMVWLVSASAAGVGKLPGANMVAMAANRTTAEHLALARHYSAEAAKFEAEARRHAELSAVYAARHDESRFAVEARQSAALSKETAKTLRNLASMHEMLAQGRFKN